MAYKKIIKQTFKVSTKGQPVKDTGVVLYSHDMGNTEFHLSFKGADGKPLALSPFNQIILQVLCNGESTLDCYPASDMVDEVLSYPIDGGALVSAYTMGDDEVVTVRAYIIESEVIRTDMGGFSFRVVRSEIDKHYEVSTQYRPPYGREIRDNSLPKGERVLERGQGAFFISYTQNGETAAEFPVSEYREDIARVGTKED